MGISIQLPIITVFALMFIINSSVKSWASKELYIILFVLDLPGLGKTTRIEKTFERLTQALDGCHLLKYTAPGLARGYSNRGDIAGQHMPLNILSPLRIKILLRIEADDGLNIIEYPETVEGDVKWAETRNSSSGFRYAYILDQLAVNHRWLINRALC